MGVSHLWDTNTVIDYLQQLFSKEAKDFMDDILKESVSAITEIELLCWSYFN